MTLAKYLKMAKLKPTAFAGKIGVATSTVTRWLHGERSPNVVQLAKIKAETDGAVTADDFLPLALAKRRAA